jgi:rhodanese-related sulfurtransferase
MQRNFFLSTLLIIMAGIALTVACGGTKVDGIRRLTNEQFKQQAAKANSVILDVRTPEEFNAGHIEGAILIDYLETENFTKQILTLDKGKNYLLYCRTGKRSLNAANVMKEKGFKQVSDLKDGISGWNGPTVTPKK